MAENAQECHDRIHRNYLGITVRRCLDLPDILFGVKNTLIRDKRLADDPNVTATQETSRSSVNPNGDTRQGTWLGYEAGASTETIFPLGV